MATPVDLIEIAFSYRAAVMWNAVLPADWRRSAAAHAVKVAFMCGALVVAMGADPQVDDRCPGTALDHGPQLISKLEPLRRAVRAEGYSGRFLFRLTVVEDGSVRDPVITDPAGLDAVKRVKDKVRELRFCPAVKYSRYTPAVLRFDVEAK